MKKTCRICKEHKSTLEFYKNRGVCKSCYSSRETERYHNNKNNYYQNTYNITLEEWNQMYVEQNGRCGCCGQHIDAKDMHTDHNHSNGEVRGLLCQGCNIGLGHLGDSPSILKKAYSYLIEKGYYGKE